MRCYVSTSCSHRSGSLFKDAYDTIQTSCFAANGLGFERQEKNLKTCQPWEDFKKRVSTTSTNATMMNRRDEDEGIKSISIRYRVKG
jgi:hypothetical protein